MRLNFHTELNNDRSIRPKIRKQINVLRHLGKKKLNIETTAKVSWWFVVIIHLPVSVIATINNLPSTSATVVFTVSECWWAVDSIANLSSLLHVCTASIRTWRCSLLRKWSAHRQTNCSKEWPRKKTFVALLAFILSK